MINFDNVTGENIEEHNLNQSQIPDHPYMILIIGSSGSGKTNASLNIINHQSDIFNKISIIINKCESVSLKHLEDPKTFIQYSNDIYDIYKNISEYKPSKKRKILLVFDDMISAMLSNKKLPQ